MFDGTIVELLYTWSAPLDAILQSNPKFDCADAPLSKPRKSKVELGLNPVGNVATVFHPFVE